MLDQRYSDNEPSRRDVPSFIEPRPPLIQNPFMRPRPQKGTNLLELFEDSEIEEPELVQVYLRLKPCEVRSNLYEVRSDKCLVTSMDTATAGHGRRTQHNVSKMYTFSKIFDQTSTQKEVFEQVVKENLKKLPDGHNFTLLTYGASGSGKTYTLMGTVGCPGLVPRSLEYVFKLIDAAQQPFYKPSDGGADKLSYLEQEQELMWVKKLRHISAPQRDKYRRMSKQLHSDLTISSMDLSNKKRHFVWVSFVEIYNEAVYDLLAPSDKRAKLRIREDTDGNVYVKGVTQAFVRSGEEAYDVMVAGKHNLVVAATGVHAHSSRSHCIFTINMLTETEGATRTSSVRLCDLAGCERARATRNTGARMQESRAINASLHVLERCLHVLRRNRRADHCALVPYRESKLTRLLGSGLSGARGEAVSMVVTLNPSPQYANETKHVLTLAAVAQDIQINNTIYASTLESSKQDSTLCSEADVMQLRADNERLHFELVQAQARNRELMAAMEERQQETASIMRELVEEAKDLTRQYYESQLEALRDQMEDMVEEYESKLAVKLEPATRKEGTPSGHLHTKIEALMTEIAILEEKLTEERLARGRAEKEVEYLRTCIEERDEKVFKENTSDNNDSNRDVMSLSNSEPESEEENDLFNESLEPVYKKENLYITKAVFEEINHISIVDDNISVHENKEMNENDRTVSEKSYKSILDESVDSERNDESTNDKVSKSSIDEEDFKDNGTEDSLNTMSNINDANENNNQSVDHTMNSCNIDSISNNENHLNRTFDNNCTDSGNESIKTTKCLITRGTYFVKDTDQLKSDTTHGELHYSFKSRGAYFMKDSVIKDSVEDSEKPDDSIKDHDTVKEDKVITNECKTKYIKLSAGTSVNQILQSIKNNYSNDNSLKQFERIEMAANNYDDPNEIVEDFGNVKILKEKKKYFDDSNKSAMEPKMEVDSVLLKLNKEKRTYFDNIDIDVKSNKNINQVSNQNDDTRSPSILKEDLPIGVGPSTIKQFDKSYTKQSEIIPLMRNKVWKHDSVDIFESPINPVPQVKNIEVTRQSFEKLDLQQTLSTKNIKIEPASSVEDTENDSPVNTSDQNYSQSNNTIDDFEKIYINISQSRATEFDLLVAQESIGNVVEAETKQSKKIETEEEIKAETIKVETQEPIKVETIKVETQEPNKVETKSEPEHNEETKYNLRHKSKLDKNNDDKKKVQTGNVLADSQVKCDSNAKLTKRSLRLRRRKNADDEDGYEQPDALKDIINLQSEFSDVTLDVPVPKKDIKDIPSPVKKMEEENLPPMMGIQSCPSKSVIRSRRKLFTPRAEPLEESSSQTGESDERIRVPRPSYHRARARRKL